MHAAGIKVAMASENQNGDNAVQIFDEGGFDGTDRWHKLISQLVHLKYGILLDENSDGRLKNIYNNLLL